MPSHTIPFTVGAIDRVVPHALIGIASFASSCVNAIVPMNASMFLCVLQSQA